MAKDVERGDDAQAAGDPAELIAERKRAAGLDKKVTELQTHIKELEAAAAERGGAAVAETEESKSAAQRLMELTATLKAREGDLAAKEKAFALAIEKGLPINLMLRGAGDLDAFMGELAELEKRFMGAHGMKAAAVRHNKPLDYSVLAKLNQREIGRIPKRIVDQLFMESTTK